MMNNCGMMFAPLGDSAVVVRLAGDFNPGRFASAGELAEMLRSELSRSVVDVVPAYETVAIFYEPAKWVGKRAPYENICAAIAAAGKKFLARQEGPAAPSGNVPRLREIPVCYGGVHGPDLEEVAMHTKFAAAEVIARHGAAAYRVQAIGFMPGFPYLSGLPAELATPRLATPRASVPAGSVGIGGAQTGVYPLVSPGGWRLIGRTPLKLFDPGRAEPAWLKVGDAVTFRAITPEEFAAWK